MTHTILTMYRQGSIGDRVESVWLQDDEKDGRLTLLAGRGPSKTMKVGDVLIGEKARAIQNDALVDHDGIDLSPMSHQPRTPVPFEERRIRLNWIKDDTTFPLELFISSICYMVQVSPPDQAAIHHTNIVNDKGLSFLVEHSLDQIGRMIFESANP